MRLPVKVHTVLLDGFEAPAASLALVEPGQVPDIAGGGVREPEVLFGVVLSHLLLNAVLVLGLGASLLAWRLVRVNWLQGSAGLGTPLLAWLHLKKKSQLIPGF